LPWGELALNFVRKRGGNTSLRVRALAEEERRSTILQAKGGRKRRGGRGNWEMKMSSNLFRCREKGGRNR